MDEAYADTLSGLVNVEMSESLFERSLRGVSFWEYIRAEVAGELVAQTSDFHLADSDFSLKPSIREGKTETALTILNAVKNAFFKNPFFSSQPDILVWGNRRKLLDDGQWWDIYYDPILEHIDEEYVLLEQKTVTKRQFHDKPAKTSNLRYLDLAQFSGAVLHKIQSRPELTENEVEEVHEIERAFETETGVRPEIEVRVEDLLASYNARKPVFTKLLKRIDPDIVVNDPGYHIFTAACNDQGIPVVTLQTGIPYENHPLYHFPGNPDVPTFGDYLFVWGDYWHDAAAYPLPDDRIFTAGFPFMDMNSKKYKKLENKDQVLFVSQPTIGRSLSEFAAETASSDPSSDILYKLHPLEESSWTEEYPWLAETNIEILPPRSGDLYQLLAESKAVVGVNSTTLWESLPFDTQIFQIPYTGFHESRHLAEAGISTVVENPNELLAHLENGIDPPNIDDTYYFESGAIQNHHRYLKELLEDSTRATTSSRG
jgi:hypothetical protein